MYWDGAKDNFVCINGAGDVHEAIDTEKDHKSGNMRAKFSCYGWQQTTFSIIDYQHATFAEQTKSSSIKKKPVSRKRPAGTNDVGGEQISKGDDRKRVYSKAYHRAKTMFLENEPNTKFNALKASEIGRKAGQKAVAKMK